jgi:hypothetical protein
MKLEVTCEPGSQPTQSREIERKITMIVLAKGSITKPDALAPYVDDEMRVVGELKAEGVIKALYRRAAVPGCTSSSRDPASTPYEAEWTSCRLSSRAS